MRSNLRFSTRSWNILMKKRSCCTLKNMWCTLWRCSSLFITSTKTDQPYEPLISKACRPSILWLFGWRERICVQLVSHKWAERSIVFKNVSRPVLNWCTVEQRSFPKRCTHPKNILIGVQGSQWAAQLRIHLYDPRESSVCVKRRIAHYVVYHFLSAEAVEEVDGSRDWPGTGVLSRGITVRRSIGKRAVLSWRRYRWDQTFFCAPLRCQSSSDQLQHALNNASFRPVSDTTISKERTAAELQRYSIELQTESGPINELRMYRIVAAAWAADNCVTFPLYSYSLRPYAVTVHYADKLLACYEECQYTYRGERMIAIS